MAVGVARMWVRHGRTSYFLKVLRTTKSQQTEGAGPNSPPDVLAPTAHRTELEGKSCTWAFFIIEIFPPELGPGAAAAYGKCGANRANRARPTSISPCGSLEVRRLESAASSSGESGGKLGKSEGLR